MKGAFLVLGGLAVIVFGMALWCMGAYNGLVAKQEAVNAAWAQVQNVYQRRFDLIPNLVETVKGAAKFEQGTLTAVTEARASVGKISVDAGLLNDPEKFRQFEKAESALTGALSRLLAVSERYPELKANANFRDLQVQLEGSENRIAVERRGFNEFAAAYNIAIRRMPDALVARLAGFRERPYFQAEESAQKAPAVKF